MFRSRKKNNSTKFIIGIAGQSGSGKTTIANDLVKQIGPEDSIVISMDNYYKDLSALTPDNDGHYNFDHPNSLDFDLLAKHLSELKNGRAVDIPTYSIHTCLRQPETIHIEPKKIIILEGIFALYPTSLLKMYDAKIYINTDPDICLIRRALRDETATRTMHEIFAQYLKDVKPMHQKFVAPTKKNADLVHSHNIDGDTISKIELYALLERKAANAQSSLHPYLNQSALTNNRRY